ncbi:MAG: hypothetical protein M3452_03420 [Chloroflexota bacterium]|nr:hypothetical protein [Chloroflexota bacterium]
MAREADETETEGTRRGPGGTPEGHTPEAAAADEFGKKGTPAAGLRPDAPHAADVQEEDAHGGEEHTGSGHDTDEHAGEPLGPIDWPAWGASAFGVAMAILIAAALALPTLRL